MKTMVDLLWRLINKINILVPPLPEEIVEGLARYSLSGVPLSDAVRLLQEEALRRIYHRGAWIRVLMPLIELLYSIMRARPDIKVRSLETLRDLYLTDLATIDLVRFVLRRRLTDDIVQYIYTRLTYQVKRDLYESAERLSTLLGEHGRVCIISTSCVSCHAAKYVFGERADTVCICVSAPPPMQLMVKLALEERLSPDLVQVLYGYLRKYILDYVVTSSFLSEAYMRFVKDNADYVELARRLFFSATSSSLSLSRR